MKKIIITIAALGLGGSLLSSSTLYFERDFSRHKDIRGTSSMEHSIGESAVFITYNYDTGKANVQYTYSKPLSATAQARLHAIVHQATNYPHLRSQLKSFILNEHRELSPTQKAR